MTDVVIDIETTGLDPARHDIWEIAAIVHDHRDPNFDGQWWWQLHPDLARAEPIALLKSHYYQRTKLPPEKNSPGAAVLLDSPLGPVGAVLQPAVAGRLALLLAGATVYGAVPSFDLVEFLAPFLRRHGQCGTWNHRLRCVETLTAGYLCRDVGGLRDCADALAITYDPDDLHTALGDARLADEIRRRILGHEHQWVTLRTFGDPDATEVCEMCSALRAVPEADEPVCRVCGCTDSRACEGGCGWVSDPVGPGDLCSSCLHGVVAESGLLGGEHNLAGAVVFTGEDDGR